ALDLEQWKPGDRLSLGVRLPFRRAPEHPGTKPGRSERVFDLLAAPVLQRPLYAFPAVGAVQQLEHTVAMMGEIRVQLQPAAVAGLIIAGDRIPEVAVRLAVRGEVAFAAQRNGGREHFERDRLLAPRPKPPELARRESRGSDGRRR